MRRRRGTTGIGMRAIVALALLLAPARAEDDADDPLMGAEPIDALLWSATLMGQVDGIHPDQDDDGRGGFFDQYEFTPNKDPGVGAQIGVRDASLDWIVDRAPRLQLRFESPTSNLGVTGSDFDDAFQNQRALVLGRTEAFQLDLEYRRFRTEQLRLFPETDAGGGALPFTDLTRRNDRFYRERTGFLSELRWRPDVPLVGGPGARSRYAPELSVRGGRERRESKRQILALLEPGNDWLGLSDPRGDDLSDAGAGLLVVPARDVTLTLDYDYQEFEADNAIVDDDLPFASTSRSVRFIPSSRRHTAQALLHGRVGENAVWSAGFQATHLDQQSPDTPAQGAAGFGENEALIYTGRLSGDLQLGPDLAASATLKIAYRDRDLDRSTGLFSPNDGSQVDEFLESYYRIDGAAELRYRQSRNARFAGGLRLRYIDRDLDFARSGLGNTVIQPETALINDETQMWTLFVRGDLRPRPSLSLHAEASYRIAPDTGYITDLDQYFRGELRGTWSLPLARPATVSLLVRGGVGENSDFSLVGGLAPDPPGPSKDRDYDRSHWTVGLTSDWIASEDVTLFGSLFYSGDRQGDELLLSTAQRYFQEAIPIAFDRGGGLDFQRDELSLILGSQVFFSERTDGGMTYSYTRADADYDSGSTRPVLLIDSNRIVDADIHAVELELRHRLRAGLRLFAGYRLQYYSDGAPKPSTTSSVRQPADRSDLRHTATFGITLDGDLLARR